MSDIIFCDPPRRGHSDDLPWADIAEALMERPGEWARVASMPKASPASTIVSLVKKGRIAAIPGGFEAKSARYVDDGHERFGVWMRYVAAAPSVDGIPEAVE